MIHHSNGGSCDQDEKILSLSLLLHSFHQYSNARRNEKQEKDIYNTHLESNGNDFFHEIASERSYGRSGLP